MNSSSPFVRSNCAKCYNDTTLTMESELTPEVETYISAYSRVKAGSVLNLAGFLQHSPAGELEMQKKPLNDF